MKFKKHREVYLYFGTLYKNKEYNSYTVPALYYFAVQMQVQTQLNDKDKKSMEQIIAEWDKIVEDGNKAIIYTCASRSKKAIAFLKEEKFIRESFERPYTRSKFFYKKRKICAMAREANKELDDFLNYAQEKEAVSFVNASAKLVPKDINDYIQEAVCTNIKDNSTPHPQVFDDNPFESENSNNKKPISFEKLEEEKTRMVEQVMIRKIKERNIVTLATGKETPLYTKEGVLLGMEILAQYSLTIKTEKNDKGEIKQTLENPKLALACFEAIARLEGFVTQPDLTKTYHTELLQMIKNKELELVGKNKGEIVDIEAEIGK